MHYNASKRVNDLVISISRRGQNHSIRQGQSCSERLAEFDAGVRFSQKRSWIKYGQM